MEIIEDKALVFRTRNPNKYGIIPKHKVVERMDEGYDVMVYWGLDEVRVLRNLGVKDVPSPITRRYSWPGRYKPMQHQIDTASFLTIHKRAFCFNDPGTGKTLSALWAADYLMQRGDVRRCLILCPLSIMQSAWLSDLNNSIIHRSAIVAHHPKASRRIEMIQQDYDFVICNYDGLNLIADEIVADGRFDLVIVDEANAYKTVTTKRWKTLKSIIGPQTHLWMMTGTPASQSPVDAYGLAKMCVPDKAPQFFGDFRQSVMIQYTMYRWEPRPEAKEIVFEMLQPAIRFEKDQCLDLPDVTFMTRIAPLTAEQKRYYKELKDEMLLESGGEEVSAVNAAAKMNKLLQISGGAVYTDSGTVVHFDVSSRLQVIEEVIEEASHKVLIFVPFTHTIKLVSDHLTKAGITNEIIDGSVPVAKRTQVFKAFQEKPEPRVLVIQPQAAAHGVTLTAADTIIWYSPVTSVETYLQANARIDRPGQKNSMTVFHIQGSPIETRLYAMLQGNISNHEQLVDLYKKELSDA